MLGYSTSSNSLDYGRFGAVIKSAAIAASRKPKLHGSDPRLSSVSRAVAQAVARAPAAKHYEKLTNTSMILCLFGIY